VKPRFFAWLDRLPVGLKLSATLILVVVCTALVLLAIQHRLAGNLLDRHGRLALKDQLTAVDKVLALTLRQEPDPQQALRLAYRELKDSFLDTELVYLVGLNGQVHLPAELAEANLPPRDTLLHMVRVGGGLMEVRLESQDVWLAFHRLGDGRLVLVVQAHRRAVVGPILSALRRSFVAGTLALCLLAGVFAVWVARRELGRPLGRLTEAAERVAGGDLTPPDVLPGREDEVGRLSRALNKMTHTALEMVAEARATQSRFQQIFSDNRDAILIIGEDGSVEAVNPAAAQMFGFEGPEAMQGLESTEGLFARPAEREYYLEILGDQGFVKDYPAVLRRTDGTSFDALITATRRGRQARFAMVRDVTQTLAAQRALLESEERYRRLLENAPDIIYRWSIAEARFDYLSPAVESITGMRAQEILNDPGLLWHSVHPRSREKAVSHWRKMVRGEGPELFEHEFEFLHRSGETRWLRERSLLIRDRQGRAKAVEGLATDITQAKKLEQALRQGQQMVEATLQGLPAAVMVLDRHHRVVHWNRAMARLTGVPGERMVGTTDHWRPFYPQKRPVLADLILDMDWDEIRKLYGEKGLKRSPVIGGGLECEDFFPGLGGQDRHLYFLGAPIVDEDGKVVRVVETLVDLSDKRALEEELRRLSVTDDLTGLFNQRFFYATLRREVEAARRYGRPLSLLLMDLDLFKRYNDTYGHLEGDRVLARVAATAQAAVRSTDLPCRYGGEEFVVLLPQTDLAEALQVAERVRFEVEALVFHPQNARGEPEAARVSLSIGAAQFGPEQDMHELVRGADRAMYTAKEAGRNRVAAQRREGLVEVVAARAG
jgi:diguanylate cyclase (GGDEF)-like protein/PAS domain S-box-containing protein